MLGMKMTENGIFRSGILMAVDEKRGLIFDRCYLQLESHRDTVDGSYLWRPFGTVAGRPSLSHQ